MPNQIDVNIFMQSLRGNQPMIVLAFLLFQTQMTVEELETVTGLHSDTVRSAVKGLESKGLLHKQIGEHGRATWLPSGSTFFGKLFQQGYPQVESQSPKFSDSAALIDVNVAIEGVLNNKATSLTINDQNRKKPYSEKILTVKTINKDAQDVEDCLAELRAAGIHGKKADEIAEDWHITVTDIRAHLAWVKTEEWGNPNGMVIYRLLNHVIPPPLAENGHLMDCRCNSCQIEKLQKRHTDSAYSEFLNREDDDEEES